MSEVQEERTLAQTCAIGFLAQVFVATDLGIPWRDLSDDVVDDEIYDQLVGKCDCDGKDIVCECMYQTEIFKTWSDLAVNLVLRGWVDVETMDEDNYFPRGDDDE